MWRLVTRFTCCCQSGVLRRHHVACVVCRLACMRACVRLSARASVSVAALASGLDVNAPSAQQLHASSLVISHGGPQPCSRSIGHVAVTSAKDSGSTRQVEILRSGCHLVQRRPGSEPCKVRAKFGGLVAGPRRAAPPPAAAAPRPRHYEAMRMNPPAKLQKLATTWDWAAIHATAARAASCSAATAAAGVQRQYGEHAMSEAIQLHRKVVLQISDRTPAYMQIPVDGHCSPRKHSLVKIAEPDTP